MRAACLILGLILQIPAWPQALPVAPQNGDFAQGEAGEIPKGWVQTKPARDAGFRVELVVDQSLPGKRAVMISRESGSGGSGNLMQTLDATPYWGKRVRLKTQLSVESCDGAQGQLWLRVNRPMGFAEYANSRSVKVAHLTPAEIVMDVDRDAVNIALGMMLTEGNGRLRVAPVGLEVLGNTPKPPTEGPKPLTPRGLTNLSAFARAFNYIRFFHPADEAAAANWNRLAAEGVRAVEGATSTKDLAHRMLAFFKALAPTARFLTPGQTLNTISAHVGGVFAVRWSHVGLGQGQHEGPYHSARQYVSLVERAGEGWTDPNSPTQLDLGGGIKLALPMVCVADSVKATLPKARFQPEAIDPNALPEPTAGCWGSGDDRATRLGDVVLAWGVFQHFYPYFEVVETDWNAELPQALRRAAEDKSGEAFAGTLRQLVAALHDGHGGVYSAGTVKKASPALVLSFVDGKPMVSVAGPSAKAIPLGSCILAVDGEPVQARLEELKKEISAATPGWMERRLEFELLAGQPSTTVTVSVSSPGGVLSKATLPRDADHWELRSKDPRKPAPLAELRPGIWYMDLSRISGKAFGEALPKLVAAKGVVFDLRAYPTIGSSMLGHLTDKPLQSAQWNIPIVTQPDGKGWEWHTPQRWNLEPLEPRILGKVAFLAGPGAISQAESFLGIVEAYKLAEIVGESTAGTNGNNNPFTLPGGYTITWTGMKVLKHDGSQHHGVGILPTIPVKPTIKGLAAGKDEVLEAGLEAVSR